jgi:acyl-CoA thioesterase I
MLCHPTRRHAFAILAAFAAFAMAPASAQAQPVKLVALGDSLTAGYGLARSEALPAQLERALKARGIEATIANAGVSGDTASGGAERAEWSVPDGTQGVILALGANDMLRGVDPDVTRRALDRIIAGLQKRKIPVLLVGMYAPRNLGQDYYRRFDAIYPDLARKYDLALYPFLLEGVAGQRRLNLQDGVHPTAEGVALITKQMLPTVETFLRRIAGA